jgi:hypothetical protein
MSFLPVTGPSNVPRSAPSDLVLDTMVDPWVRPSEWLDLNKPEGVPEKIIGLIAVYPDELKSISWLSFLCTTVTGGVDALTIDWGDGNIETVNSNSTVTHVYDYNDLPADTEFRGYRQARFELTPTAVGDKFGSMIDFNKVGPATSSTIYWGSAILDMFISTSNCTRIRMGTTYPQQLCEQIAIRNTPNNRLTTDYLTLYYYKRSLKSIPEVPYMTEGNKSHANAFIDCHSLEAIPDEFANPDKSWFDENTANMQGTFQGCHSLRYLPPGLFGDLPNCTNFYRTFRNCFMLEHIPYMGISTTVSEVWLREMFLQCSRLKAIPQGFNISKVRGSQALYGLYGTFNGCNSIQDWSLLNIEQPETTLFDMSLAFGEYSAYFPNIAVFPYIGQFSKVYDLFATFQYKSIRRFSSQYTYLDFTNCTRLRQTFSSCYYLEELPPIHVSALTQSFSLAYTFQNCYRLREVTIVGMTAGPADGEYTRCFLNCYDLQKISGIDWSYTNDSGDLSSAFQSCRNLAYIDFPGGPTDETGFKHSVVLSYIRLDRDAILNIFNHLCTITHSATIDLRYNSYTADLTAADKLIATNKGWTISL